MRKDADGSWQGMNLTYYGLINACSVTAAVALMFILLAGQLIWAAVFVYMGRSKVTAAQIRLYARSDHILPNGRIVRS